MNNLMNNKQKQIIELYFDAKKSFKDLLEMNEYHSLSQDKFLTKIGNVIISLQKFNKIQERSSEQWQFWFGLSELEFKEVIDYLKENEIDVTDKIKR